MSKESMNRAKSKKDDEWYTRYEDVAKELPNYARYLRGKKVICPCDDPRMSRIYKWLKENYHRLGLKRLISSHLDLPTSFWTDYDGVKETKHAMAGNGDFLGAEARALMSKADVVITNPPFSLIRPFVDELVALNKDYIFVAPMTILYYKNIFPLVVSKRMRPGFNMVRKFDNNPKPLGMVSWVTSFPIPYHAGIPLHNGMRAECTRETAKLSDKRVISVLHVPKLAYIPKGYKGVMAVPTTILYHWNPNQFSIVGQSHSMNVNGKMTAVRIMIKAK